MTQDPQQFEQLRRLLALKRHEQPPPGYFNNFSRQVIVRIKAGETGAPTHVLERVFWEAPWLQRLLAAFEARPIVASACGVAVCGLMLTGLLYTDKTDVTPMALVPAADSSFPGAMTSLAPSEQQPFAGAPAMMVSTPAAPSGFDLLPSSGSLLGDIQQLKADRQQLTADRVSLTLPAGN